MSPDREPAADSDGAKPPWQDVSKLARLYWGEGYSTHDLAARWGCSAETVRRWLRKHDLGTRDRIDAVQRSAERFEEAPYRDPQVLRHLYWGEGLSMEAIGERLDCAPTTVFKWLREHNIETRSRTAAASAGDEGADGADAESASN